MIEFRKYPPTEPSDVVLMDATKERFVELVDLTNSEIVGDRQAAHHAIGLMRRSIGYVIEGAFAEKEVPSSNPLVREIFSEIAHEIGRITGMRPLNSQYQFLAGYIESTRTRQGVEA